MESIGVQSAPGYVFYNSPASRETQNQNTVCGPKSQYPRAIYRHPPFNESKCQPYRCRDGPRDHTIDYFFGADVTQHPNHFSHFGYPWCPNGYCMANFPGRYNTPPAMRWQTSAEPKGMAPCRYYEGKYADHNYNSSDAYNQSWLTRQGR